MRITMIERPITKNQAYIKNVQQADSRYTDFQKRGAKGAVLHSVGTPQPSAKAFAEYFDSARVEASVHAVLQADGVCYKLAPWNYRMWHVGGSANNTHLGVEMTEPDCIAYDAKNGYKLTILDRERALSHVKATYQAAVELFAAFCKEFGWDPLEDGVILSHAECHQRGLGSNHGDPEHLWKALNTGYTMDTFRAAVAEKLRESEQGEEEEQSDELKNRFDELLIKHEKTLEDNDAGAWSKEAREWAIREGIVNGIGTLPDGTANYAWEAHVTREQLVTMLYRAIGG